MFKIKYGEVDEHNEKSLNIICVVSVKCLYIRHQKIVENIDIDYNKANLKDVSRYFALAHYSKNYKKVTMDGTVKELKKIGFKKKSNMNEE